jgi:hypothetical protein
LARRRLRRESGALGTAITVWIWTWTSDILHLYSTMFTDPPALRTRASRLDSRVQIIEIAPTDEKIDGNDGLSSSPSKVQSNSTESRPKRTMRSVKLESFDSPQTHDEGASTKRIKIESSTPTPKSMRSSTTRRPTTKGEQSPLNDIEDLTPPPPNQATPTLKSTPKPRAYTPTKIRLSLDKPHPEPPHWRRQYELIEKMREKIVAPVDTL